MTSSNTSSNPCRQPLPATLELLAAMHDVDGGAHNKLLMASPEITLEAVPSVGDISPADWDACANPQAAAVNDSSSPSSGGLAGSSCAGLAPYYNPFVSHAFFQAAEE